ncbi:MAG: carboxypeptidase regulatory-like domain-containing protein [Candidatus Moranbacteria bacterium]|nr:carboxypeptidase regulatory-like domain-containing protein [Candidatus Moranbacteria bacterium]
MQKTITNNKKAFSLIEVLIVTFIMATVFTSFYSVSTVGTKYIIESKNRLAAVAFANEKMEIARNLEYSDVGLISGIPVGNMPEDEDVMANGRMFHVHTFVEDIDDPLDGTGLADGIPNDYKLVKITISWNDSNGEQQKVVSISRFVPPGLETSAGGAPMAINVKGSDGVAVGSARVDIVNNEVLPVINYSPNVDSEGHMMIPAAPASLGGYHLTISKAGYETVATMDSPSLDYLGNPYTPTYTHASVLLNVLNMYDYIVDELSSLTIKAVDYQNNPIGNLAFTVDGGKVLGRDILNVDVLNMHEAGTTDAVTGEKKYDNISPGNYKIVLAANAQYEFVEYSPNPSPIALVPGTDLTFQVNVADKDVDGLLVNVIDNDTSSPVIDAKITLTDSASVEVFSGKSVSANGILYYPDTAVSLPAGNYTLKVEATNYVTQDIPVVIDKLTKPGDAGIIKLIKT